MLRMQCESINTFSDPCGLQDAEVLIGDTTEDAEFSAVLGLSKNLDQVCRDVTAGLCKWATLYAACVEALGGHDAEDGWFYPVELLPALRSGFLMLCALQELHETLHLPGNASDALLHRLNAHQCPHDLPTHHLRARYRRQSCLSSL
jgi:hypothetical protein